ncbi:BPSS1780 family membrane protein [Telluria mixta]|uniref:BPSS1780 family membrane protein n=1 Tax=Telluria mixta TaxID=34071 RepID=A0ABT2BWH5_9BURK|nr:BPSS1780 family membrane protein [Telluria mixta]MCS0629475.1 BPSS1780 family membrane protein [Telluria mixta]WEM96949.1 BPSS1780 family membrane protein [Telluria mixta]
MNDLPARTGWEWLKQGIGLFRKQPAALTTLLFANILFSIGLSAVPILGSVLAVVLIPSFTMAFMQACLMIENGDRVTPAVLLTGFRRPALAALCKLGLVYLGVSLLMMVITRLAIPPEVIMQMMPRPDAKTPPTIQTSHMLALFGVFLLDVAVLVTLCFAAPLTYWKHMGPGKATFYSFFAVIRTARPFLVLLAAWFGIFFGICILAALVFGDAALGRVVLMWLIFLFMLLLQCAMYAGYRTIFGKPADKAPQPA